jgi:tetratricopeptide (TPR) repeat protein
MDSRAPTVEELLRISREDIARNSLTSAEQTLEQAILMNNQVPDAFYLLGYVYSKRGKFKKAILAFQKTLQLDPFHTDAAIALSSLYNDVGKYKEGAAVYYRTKKRLDRTLPGHDPRINQSLAQKHFELGLLYVRFERFQEAHHEFTKALNLEPDNVTYSVQMAKCLAKTGDKPGAIGFLRKTLQRQPKSVEARIQLGILLHSQQLLKDAQREWQEALAIDPENKSAQMYLSMLDYEPGSQRVQ